MTLSEDTGSEKTRSACRTLMIRLSGRAPAAEVRRDVQAALQSLQAAINDYEDAHDERVCATAEIEVCDTEVDQAVAALVRAVEVQLRGDRQDPRFLAAFPYAPSEATGGVATDAQRNYVHSALTVLRSDTSLCGALKPDLDALEAAQAALDAAVKVRAALEHTEATASARLKVATLQARNVHNDALPRLQLIYPRQKARVRSFFLR